MTYWISQAAYLYNPPVFLKVNQVLCTAISMLGVVWLYYTAWSSGLPAELVKRQMLHQPCNMEERSVGNRQFMKWSKEREMDKEEIIQLIEVVDDLIDLNDAIMSLTGSIGYAERFAALDNVYDVIRLHSKFANQASDAFYSILENNKLTPEQRANILTGIEEETGETVDWATLIEADEADKKINRNRPVN